MAIEIDGHNHYEPEQRTYDEARTQWLEQRGIKVIRFTNHEVDTQINEVLEKIAKECHISTSP